MTEIDKMKRAKNYIDMLANGKDPVTGEDVPDDSVLNNVRLSRCFFYVSDVLQQVIDNGGEVSRSATRRGTPYANDFRITEEQRKRIPVSQQPIGVVQLTKHINSVLDEGLKPLAAVKVTEWLLDNGYLVENTIGGKRVRVSSKKGEAAGIVTVDRQNQYGVSYKKNEYSPEAQQMIISKLNLIAGTDSKEDIVD